MIEILVVMAIIAILLGWGAVHMVTHLSDYRLKAAARDLVSIVQKARMTAVRNNADTAIVFRPSDGISYALCTENGDGDWSTMEDNICPAEIDFATYNSGIDYGHGSSTSPVDSSFGANNVSYALSRVVFTSRGSSRNSGYAYIENDAGDSYAVGTTLVGTIVCKKWDGDSWEYN